MRAPLFTPLADKRGVCGYRVSELFKVLRAPCPIRICRKIAANATPLEGRKGIKELFRHVSVRLGFPEFHLFLKPSLAGRCVASFVGDLQMLLNGLFSVQVQPGAAVLDWDRALPFGPSISKRHVDIF